MTVFETGEATAYALSAQKETRTVMDGVPSSHVKASALKALNDLTGVWVERGGLEIGMIGI